MSEGATVSIHDNNSDDGDDGETSAFGGAVRSVFRAAKSVTRTVSSVAVGRLPHLPAKTVARSAGKLGDVYDITDSIRTAHEHATINSSDEAKTGSTKSSSRPNRWAHAAKVARTALPSFIRSAILGTVVFDVYESSVCELSEGSLASLPNGPFFRGIADRGSVIAKTHPVLADSVIAITGGTAGGLAHALGYIAWGKGAGVSRMWSEHILSQPRFRGLAVFLKRYGVISISGRSFTPAPPVHTLGTCVSHVLVHSSLFGSYVATKLLLLGFVDEVLVPAFSRHYDTKHDVTADKSAADVSLARSQAQLKFEHYCGLVCITAAGGVAGIVSETMSAVTENAELEVAGVRQALSNLRATNLLPRIGQVLTFSALLPNILGFLAFEYGKEIIENGSAMQANHLTALKGLY